MSEKRTLDRVCVAYEARTRFTTQFIEKMAGFPVELFQFTPENLKEAPCEEVRALLGRAKYLVVLLGPDRLESDCIGCAVHHFKDLGKRQDIIPVFFGRISPDAALASPLIRKFGDRIIQSQDMPLDELTKAVCSRFRGMSDTLMARKDERPGDVPSSGNVFRVKNSIVKIMTGNILESKCEVIVSSDDNMLSHGGGVSQAIFDRGGDAISDDAEKNIPAELGDIVVTTAGELPQKYVFHAVTLALRKSIPALQNDWVDIQEYIIRNAVRKSFSLLHMLNITSIAFPMIGTGVAGIPFEKALECMLSAFAEEIRKTARPLLVELWIFHNSKGYDVRSMARMKLADKTPEEFSPSTSDPLLTEYDIFISYSRIDLEKTNLIIDALNEKHFRYWRDVDGTYSGSSYKSVIVQAIRKSRIVIFVSSENSNKSPHVEKEIGIAVEEKKKIIPIKIDSSKYSDAINYDLSNIDFIDWEKEPDPGKKLYLSICTILAGALG
ncbi:MAG: TIR domain-containing protein [Lentisphaeria bacterium]|nr:TIR domain-containing protein [Lentisphaeria bacterium]